MASFVINTTYLDNLLSEIISKRFCLDDKMSYLTEDKVITGISTYANIPDPLKYVLLDVERLKLELVQ